VARDPQREFREFSGALAKLSARRQIVPQTARAVLAAGRKNVSRGGTGCRLVLPDAATRDGRVNATGSAHFAAAQTESLCYLKAPAARGKRVRAFL
jgi:hypothetical protein